MPDRLGAPPPGPVLVLTPTGRDAEGAVRLLAAEAIEAHAHPTLPALAAAVNDDAGLVLVADEALLGADLSPLAARMAAQPPWSDLPVIVLTQAGLLARRRAGELDLPARLGNVVFLERPLNAMSLVSAVRAALRARQRQRQVRDYLAGQADAAERTAALLEARVRERTAALEAAEAERARIAAALAQSQKMEAVGQLTGGLAHDFNNMLAGIIGSLERMQTRLARGEADQLGRYIDLAQQGARRAAALTHRMLAFSRRQTLDPRPTGINRLVEGMSELIRSTVGPEVELSMTLDAQLWPTLCDPHQLENALLNLCINARDAMPEGGRLVVRTANAVLSRHDAAALREAAAGDYVVLEVVDSGTGMPPDVIARAFDPFFTTKPLGQGTGLGLSMIYGFVQQSGGSVQIVSEPGQGTAVRLYLPRHDGVEEHEPSPAGTTSGVVPPARETVLVVDDEPTVRLLVAEVLSELGYDLLDAPNGPAALQVLHDNPRVGLLVTDMGMPGGLNGRQLAEAARVDRPGLKVLFITGYAEGALPRGGMLDAGMDVMTKPFAAEELAGRVRDLIHGR